MLLTLTLIIVLFALVAINSDLFSGFVSTETFEENNQVEGFYYGERFERIVVKGTKSELKAMDKKVYQVVEGITVAL